MNAVHLPTIADDAASGIVLRGIRMRDARALDHELKLNRTWLRTWEATNPSGFTFGGDPKSLIRLLLAQARDSVGIPLIIELDGALVGQLNVSSLVYGSLSSGQIGYWIAERAAGRNVTPAAVAMATDYCFSALGLHRMEICIRPENAASLRVVEKLGFRYEGLRRRYIHINGDWRDHFAFALVREDVPEGVLNRWRAGRAPVGDARIPASDAAAASRDPRLDTPTRYPSRAEH
jgi:ribosomal-protein-alanine N-acetyltransferase